MALHLSMFGPLKEGIITTSEFQRTSQVRRESPGGNKPLFQPVSHTGIYPQLGIYHSFLHHHVDLLSLHLLT